jgi:GMC oxidoreductase
VTYLRPAKKRANLQVVTNALVHRVVFDGKRAVAVEFSRRSGVERVDAGREVLLSAGAIGSPHLLQLSGVGGPEVLQKAAIAVRHALPGVGRNFQDHLDHFWRWMRRSGRPAGDASTGRSALQSQGCSQPPHHNAQEFGEARNPITVADIRRRCKGSGRVRPCWDQAFPCYSPLGSAAASAGRALQPLAASRPSEAVAASSCLSEVGPVLLGSAHWQNYLPAHSGSGWGGATACPEPYGAHGGGSAASPTLCRRPKTAGTTYPA